MILNAIICYNNYDEVARYITDVTQLYKSEEVAFSIIINDDNISGVEILKGKLDAIDRKIAIKKAQCNLGYINGLIEAVKNYKDIYNEIIDWIIMSNTDITYPDLTFIENFINKKYDDSIWCVAPSVYVPSKKAYENPVSQERRTLKGVNKIIKIFSTVGLRTLYQRAAAIKSRLLKNHKRSGGYVYEVHGCYFIIRKELYEKMLTRPYRAFMYSEEAYVAELIYHNNKKAYYDSDLEVYHNEHSVTSRIKYKKIADYTVESMKFIKEEFYK